MKMTGAQLACFALESLGISHTFGIPGVHTTELYDELEKSKTITPILVTHEQSASFMADAVSRTSDSVGCIVVVPAAGLTHAMSGIGEAYVDGIPMLVITGGIKRELDKRYQLHELDQQQVAHGITKAQFLVKSHAEVIPTLYEAYSEATEGEPGPVMVEIPFEILSFLGESPKPLPYVPHEPVKYHNSRDITAVVDLLKSAEKPVLYVGWGAVNATEQLIQLAEAVGAPVATTLQGLSSFPASHPLHAGMGFGHASVPAAQKSFKDHDLMIAVGVRFSELATGSYGIEVSENLVHIDINPEVFHKNYPAKVAIQGDASIVLQEILQELSPGSKECSELRKLIRTEKENYRNSWKRDSEIVSPISFFDSLSKEISDSTIVVTDDGNHTFLTAELLPLSQPKQFISPTDFNCMGYAIPAAIGSKLANPSKEVVAIVGDGAFMMTGMELTTAASLNQGIVFVVFSDAELGQIASFQKTIFNRKVCTKLPSFQLEPFAQATGCAYFKIENNSDCADVLARAFAHSRKNIPVIVEVTIDYSEKTAMTKGAAKATFSRFSTVEKLRYLSRMIKRKLLG